MTREQLHAIPQFAELFQDPRFKAALIYLRAVFPRKSEATGDEWRGRYDVLEELESLAALPQQPGKPSGTSRRYAWSQEPPKSK